MQIKTLNLTKFYGSETNKVIALNNANITIKQGEFVSITGESGSGKSTLLHLLSGLDMPTKGSVMYNDKNIYEYSDKEISVLGRNSIGFIFQQINLLPILTAKENIVMPLLLDKKTVDEEFFKSIVELLGLDDRLNHLPSELSGGQQQRVAIARALVAKPNVIFADEPTGNLDSTNSKEVIYLLININRMFKKTLIIITHENSIAKRAEKKYCITDGIVTRGDIAHEMR